MTTVATTPLRAPPAATAPRRPARPSSKSRSTQPTLVTSRYSFYPYTGSFGYYLVVRFEFDPGKSASNLAKHGIDFADAQALWDDEDHLEVPARTQDEPRWVVIGRIDGRVWTAIFTRRQGSTRIISVRRARPSEEALYEGH